MLWSLGWSTLFSIPKAAGTQLLVQFREQPRRANLRGFRALLTTIRRSERALSIDQLGDLSIASPAAANACHEFVRMEPVANPDFRADLWRGPRFASTRYACRSCFRSITSSLQSIGELGRLTVFIVSAASICLPGSRNSFGSTNRMACSCDHCSNSVK
jgi:hypothetical protein